MSTSVGGVAEAVLALAADAVMLADAATPQESQSDVTTAPASLVPVCKVLRKT